MYTLLIREMAGLLLEHSHKPEDVFAHCIGVDHLMEAVLVEIACADIDSRSIQMRRDHRDVTERSIVFFKAEAANELRKIGVIAVVEHSIICAAPIQFNENQEPAISIATEDIQGLELSGDTNTAMPQIHDSTADTNANEEQAQAS